MWMLEIALIHNVTRVMFQDRERAIAEQTKLQALLGVDIYERNREKGERTYKIESDHEICVVVVQNVQSASVVNPLQFKQAQAESLAYDDLRHREQFRQNCAIMAEYGLKG